MLDKVYIVEGRIRKFLQWVQVAASTHLFKPGVAWAPETISALPCGAHLPYPFSPGHFVSFPVDHVFFRASPDSCV